MKEAILLAAGLGTRLHPLTLDVPKCLVKIGDKPLLQYWLESLSRAGVERFHINTHYKAEQVEAFIRESEFSHCVQLHYEAELLGTGGSIKNMLEFVSNHTVLLAHADNYFELDWQDFFRAHNNRPPETVMTLLLFETDKPRDCGIVELENGIVTAFHEKVEDPPSNLASAATFLVEKHQLCKSLNGLPRVFDFSKEFVPTMLGRVFTLKTNGYWCDIGSPESYKKTNDRLKLAP